MIHWLRNLQSSKHVMDGTTGIPWYDTCREVSPATEILAETVDADISVIGAGVMGLSIALSLAEAGCRVVVLEADDIGAGASGRNGGLIIPIMRTTPETILNMIGAGGERLIETVIRSADAVFELIEKHGISCDAVRNGFLQPVHARSMVSRVEQTADSWSRWGAACKYIGAGETAALLGTDTYHGALYEPGGGYLNPLAYTRGLGRAAISKGAAIYTQSPVRAAKRRSDDKWQLIAGKGSVLSEAVVQCTSVQVPGLPFHTGESAVNSLIPMVLHGLATKPLPKSLHHRILPSKCVATDTRSCVFSIGYDSGHRLITSGAAPLGDGRLGMKQMARFVAGRLERIYPDLAGIQFEYIWKGTAALNRHWLPSLYETAPDWYALTTCNGRGMALSTITGQMFGKALAGGNIGDYVLPCAAPRPVSLRKAIGGVLARVLVPAGAIQDRVCELLP